MWSKVSSPSGRAQNNSSSCRQIPDRMASWQVKYFSGHKCTGTKLPVLECPLILKPYFVPCGHQFLLYSWRRPASIKYYSLLDFSALPVALWLNFLFFFLAHMSCCTVTPSPGPRALPQSHVGVLGLGLIGVDMWAGTESSDKWLWAKELGLAVPNPRSRP